MCTEENAEDLINVANVEFDKLNLCLQNQTLLAIDFINKTTGDFLTVKQEWSQCVLQKNKRFIYCLLEILEKSLQSIDRFRENVHKYQNLTTEQSAETTSCMLNALKYFVGRTLEINLKICTCVFRLINQKDFVDFQ